MATSPYNLAPIIEQLIAGKVCDRQTSREVMDHMMDGNVCSEQIAAYLTAMRIQGETVDALVGAATAMRARMVHVTCHRTPLMDTCGTGGDGLHTFNISTAAAFVVAACGVAVAKHGNRSASSQTGSADVLQALGLHLQASPQLLATCIDTLGIGFLFAPNHHPAMARVAPVRRALGTRTMFNLLGPLTNPAGATHQLVGVYDPRWLVPMAQALGALGSTRAWVVHSHDGLDEISIGAGTDVAEFYNGVVRTFVVTPEDARLTTQPGVTLGGEDAPANAAMLQRMFAGEALAACDAVALNAGAALHIAGAAQSLAEGVLRAQDAMRGGAAARTLKELISACGG